MKKILTLLWALLISFSIEAKTEGDSIRVLFIGNSYTYYHNLPQMVQKLGGTVALDYRMKIAVKAITPGGCTFKRHLASAETQKAIKSGVWDYVVLQEQSAAPAMPTEKVTKDTYPFAHSLDSLVLQYNPKAHVIFYMTWGHKEGCQDEHDGYPLIDTYEGMQHRLITSYLEMAYNNNAWCAPVGMAWQRVRQERPYVQLYWPDMSHPSKVGTYLAANVIFSVIFQHCYQSTFTCDLTDEMAEYIQQTAQNMVLQNMQLLNISH